jgi:hypothetical protein
MTRLSKAKAGAAEAQTAAPAIEPTLEDQRRELARKLAIFASDWRRCPRPQCRRARACRQPVLKCFGPREVRKTMPPEPERRLICGLKRALARRVAEFRSG